MIDGLIDMCLFKSYQKACSYPHGVLLYVQRTPSFTDLVDNTKTIKAISDPLCAYLMPACTTLFLQVLKQEQAMLHSNISGGSILLNSCSSRWSWKRKRLPESLAPPVFLCGSRWFSDLIRGTIAQICTLNRCALNQRVKSSKQKTLVTPCHTSSGY